MPFRPIPPRDIAISELEPEHIEQLGPILDVIDHAEEIHHSTTLSFLVDLWVSEKSKGKMANKDAMNGIETIVLSAKTNKTDLDTKTKSEKQKKINFSKSKYHEEKSETISKDENIQESYEDYVEKKKKSRKKKKKKLIEVDMNTVGFLGGNININLPKLATQKNILEHTGIDISNLNKYEKKYIKKAFRYEQSQKFYDAAKMYRRATSNAKNFIQKLKYYEKAAENYTRANKPKEIEEMYLSAIHYNDNCIQKLEYYKKVEEIYVEANKVEKAAKMYYDSAHSLFRSDNSFDLKLEYLIRAEENYVKANKAGRAAYMYDYLVKYTKDPFQKLEYCKRAAKNYEKADEPEAAARMYSKATDYSNTSFNKIYLYKKAAENYEKINEYGKVADMYKCTARHTNENWHPIQKLEYYKLAVENYKKANKPREAASIYFDMVNISGLSQISEYYKRAAEIYEKANYSKDAAVNYERANKYTQDPTQKLENYKGAAENYEKANQSYDAAEMYDNACRYTDDPIQNLKYYKKAAENYEKANEPEKAATSYSIAAEYAIDLTEKLECYNRAAENYGKVNKVGEVAKMYERVACNTDDYTQRLEYFKMAAENYVNVNDPANAAEMYFSNSKSCKDHTQRLEYYRRAAEIYEKADEPEKAAKVYVRVAYDTKDSVKRLECFEFAVEIYKRADKLNEVANIYSASTRCIKDEAQKSEYYEKAERHYKLAAENYVKENKLEEAAKMYVEASEHTIDKSAQKEYSKGAEENFKMAAENYEKANESEKAANMYVRAAYNTNVSIQKSKYYKKVVENSTLVAENYEKTNNYGKAAYQYKQSADYTNDVAQKIKYFIKAAENCESANESKEAINIYYNVIGITENFTQKLKYYKKIEKNYEKINELEKAAEMYIHVARYDFNKDYAQSLEYYKKAEKIYVKINKAEDAAKMYTNVSSRTVDPTQKLEYYNKAIENYVLSTKQSKEVANNLKQYFTDVFTDPNREKEKNLFISIIHGSPKELLNNDLSLFIESVSDLPGKTNTLTDSVCKNKFSNLKELSDMVASNEYETLETWIDANLDSTKKIKETEFFFNTDEFWNGIVTFPKTAHQITSQSLEPTVSFALMNLELKLDENNLKSLKKLLPKGGEVSKNKYTRAVFVSLIQNKPELMTKIIAKSLNSEKISKRDDARLLQIMSFANTLGDQFTTNFEKEEFKTLKEAEQMARDISIDLLSSKYSKDALSNLNSSELVEWLSVFPEFESTMTIHNDEDLIIPLRVLATNQLLKKQKEFQTHGEYIDYLIENVKTIFPKEDEQEQILEYLTKYKSLEDEKKIFLTDNEKLIRKKIIAWRKPIKISHVLEETSVVDKLNDVENRLIDVFDKEHFSKEFVQIAGLYDDAPTIKGISQQISKLIKDGASKSEREPLLSKQKSMRKYAKLQSLYLNYQQKFDGARDTIREAGKGLAPFKDILTQWNFDYGDSFGNKVFTGELSLLKQKCLQELENDKSNKRLQDLSKKIDQLDITCKKANDLVNDISNKLDSDKGIIAQLSIKEKWSNDLVEQLKKDELSINDSIKKIKIEQNSLYKIIENDLLKMKKPELITLLKRYSETTAINDLNAIVSSVQDSGSTKDIVFEYLAQQSYTKMELAMVGQCLDYRYSKNSIGNAPFTVSYMDSWRQLIVAYSVDDNAQLSPKLNGLVFLAKVSEDNKEDKTMMLTDRIWSSDGTNLGWSKIEGHILVCLKKAKQMKTPLVIPEFLSNYYEQINEWANAQGFSSRESTVNVDVRVGPTGDTYCELVGYIHYSKNATLEVNALILEPKK